MSQLSVIRANVRRNLGETTARFYTDAELNQGIGEAYQHYVIYMIEEGEGYFETSTTLALTAGVSSVSLSSLSPVFFTVSQLWRNTSQAKIPVFEKETRFVPVPTVNISSGPTYVPTFRLQSLNIILEPTPQVSEAASSTTGLTLDYNYLPTFPTSSSADSFTFEQQFPTIYEPMIELYATIAALEGKDGMGGVSDIQSFRNRLEKWEKAFEDSLLRSEFPDRVQYSGGNYSTTGRFWNF